MTEDTPAHLYPGFVAKRKAAESIMTLTREASNLALLHDTVVEYMLGEITGVSVTIDGRRGKSKTITSRTFSIAGDRMMAIVEEVYHKQLDVLREYADLIDKQKEAL